MTGKLNVSKGLSTTITAIMDNSQKFIGSFFLSGTAQNHYGKETLLDVLNNSEQPFIPFHQEDNNPVVLVQKNQILALKPQHANNSQWPKLDNNEPDCWPKVKISFSNISLEGRAYTGDMKPDQRRLIDLLNHGPVFFVFDTHQGPWILNKNTINYLEPLN